MSTLKKNKKSPSLILLVIFSVFSVYLIGNEFSTVKGATTDNQDKVFVMYAGSLVKIFEDIIGPEFQNETGHTYEERVKDRFKFQT